MDEEAHGELQPAVGEPAVHARGDVAQRHAVSPAEALDEQLAALHVVPMDHSDREIEEYHEEHCNGLLWPIFHSFPSELPLEAADLSLYRRVNQRSAGEVARLRRPGDVVWLHDHQLIPEAVIRFFLHIPSSAPDTLRTLPSREALARSPS